MATGTGGVYEQRLAKTDVQTLTGKPSRFVGQSQPYGTERSISRNLMRIFADGEDQLSRIRGMTLFSLLLVDMDMCGVRESYCYINSPPHRANIRLCK